MNDEKPCYLILVELTEKLHDLFPLFSDMIDYNNIIFSILDTNLFGSHYQVKYYVAIIIL